MKTKKNNIIIIYVILALLMLLGLAFLLKNSREQEKPAASQENKTEKSLVVEGIIDEEVNETREGVFKKRSSEKQKTTNIGTQGGSETLEILKTDEDETADDIEQNQNYNMLPGIW